MNAAHMTDAAAIEFADDVMRNWVSPFAGPIRVGSPQHLWLFSRMLLETHNPYKPAVMVWPKLALDARQCLTSLAIWDIAVQTEGGAAIRVDLCLSENERRMAGYDRRLLRPRTVPALVRVARWFLRPGRQARRALAAVNEQ